jgi:hypothetical protein
MINAEEDIEGVDPIHYWWQCKKLIQSYGYQYGGSSKNEK